MREGCDSSSMDSAWEVLVGVGDSSEVGGCVKVRGGEMQRCHTYDFSLSSFVTAVEERGAFSSVL